MGPALQLWHSTGRRYSGTALPADAPDACPPHGGPPWPLAPAPAWISWSCDPQACTVFFWREPGCPGRGRRGQGLYAAQLVADEIYQAGFHFLYHQRRRATSHQRSPLDGVRGSWGIGSKTPCRPVRPTPPLPGRPLCQRQVCRHQRRFTAVLYPGGPVHPPTSSTHRRCWPPTTTGPGRWWPMTPAWGTSFPPAFLSWTTRGTGPGGSWGDGPFGVPERPGEYTDDMLPLLMRDRGGATSVLDKAP